MHTAELLQAFAAHRGDAIVVPGRGGRHWVKLTARETLDVPLGDPAMGGHAGFALGLAIAQPNRRVVLFDSEGDILMSLGMLATIAEQAPPNFYHFMLDNECYATTGGQPVPNASNVAYDVLARGAGYPRAFAFTELADFTTKLPGILAQSGPVFVALKVAQESKTSRSGAAPDGIRAAATKWCRTCAANCAYRRSPANLRCSVTRLSNAADGSGPLLTAASD
jgi:thiamine pyrophosphate-dependent acetolactate synthase large subunit-like protein